MRHHRTWLFLSLLLGLLMSNVFWPTSPRGADIKPQADEALDELRASDEEWRQNDAEFRKQRLNKLLSEDGVAEFAEFVAILRRKMLENCQIFRTVGGDPDRLGFNCRIPKDETVSGQEPPQNPARVLTEQEKTGSLKTSLAESLREFDKKLQEKQGKLRAEVASQSPGVHTSNRNAKGDSGNDRSKPNSTGSNREGTPSPSGGSSSSSGDTPPPLADPGAGPGVEKPAAIFGSGKIASGGNDDDVVARQLREAAEKEQDPVMKEKLWDEYRKYKASKN